MAIAVGKQLASAGGADLDALLLSLRDELRTELELEVIPTAPFHIRIVTKG